MHMWDPLAEVVVRVRSREGDEVTWTQQVSCLAGTLSNWMSTTNDDTPFPTDIPSQALCMLKAIFTHARSTPAPILSSCSLEELMAVMSGANFLEANDAFRAGARQLNQRFLAGKSVEELRAVLSAEKDLSEADQAATLAEPAFTPPGGSVVGGGVLEDLLEEALRETDAAALCRLKAVSASWRSRARRELCNRLCRREGQVAPSTFESITDLDVERLRSVARPWAVAAVARWLPQLARLHGYGFVVDVHAVRQAALPPLGQPALRGPLGGAALRGCITGEGPPPAELLLAAVACAACGDVLGVPVQRLREDDAIGTLDLTGHSIGVLGARLLAFLLPAASSVCNLCVRCNELGPEGAATLAEQLRASPALTSLDLAQNYLGVQGGTALAEGLKGSAVTSLNLAFNGIGAEGVTKLAAVLGQTEIAHLNLMGSSLCGVNQYGRGTYTCEGITKLCAGLKGSAVTLLNVRENSLEGSAKVAIRMVFKDLPIELLI